MVLKRQGIPEVAEMLLYSWRFRCRHHWSRCFKTWSPRQSAICWLTYRGGQRRHFENDNKGSVISRKYCGMTWTLPLVKKFWNEIWHDPNDFPGTKVSREEAAFFRAIKNFVRSVWDLMSLIFPPSPLNPKNPPPTHHPPPPPLFQDWNEQNTLNWQQKARNKTTTTTKATKRSKSKVKRKKYIKKQNWQEIDLNEVGWSGRNSSWLERLRSKRSKLGASYKSK